MPFRRLAALSAALPLIPPLVAVAAEFVALLGSGSRPCFSDVGLQCTDAQTSLLPDLISSYNRATSAEQRLDVLTRFMVRAVAIEAQAPQLLDNQPYVVTRYDAQRLGVSAVQFLECYPNGDAAHGRTLAVAVMRWARFHAKLN